MRQRLENFGIVTLKQINDLPVLKSHSANPLINRLFQVYILALFSKYCVLFLDGFMMEWNLSLVLKGWLLNEWMYIFDCFYFVLTEEGQYCNRSHSNCGWCLCCRVAVWVHSAEAGVGDHVSGNQRGAGEMAVWHRVWQVGQGEQVSTSVVYLSLNSLRSCRLFNSTLYTVEQLIWSCSEFRWQIMMMSF